MSKKQRTIPPSRKKYEETNPVISFRVPKELHERLQAAREKESISYSDILKAGLGLLEVKIRSEAEIREKAFREGHRKGYELAESIYKITFPCKVCRETITIEDETTRKAIQNYLIKAGWGHASCVD